MSVHAPATPANRRRRTDPGWLLTVACGAGLLVFFGVYLSGVLRAADRQWATDFVYIPVAAVSMAMCVRTALDPRLSRRTRWAWAVLGAACGCKLFADTAWWWLDAVRGGPVPFPSLADLGFLSFIPVTMVGLFLFQGRRLSRPERLRLTLDVATVCSAAFMVLWYLVLGPTAAAGGVGTFAAVTAVSYPIGDLVLVVGIVTVLLRRPPRASRRPLQLLLVALSVHVVADAYYGYVNLHGGFVGGTWPDLCFLTATFLFGAAAVDQRFGMHTRPEPVTRAWSQFAVTRLPYLAVGVSLVLLLVIARKEGMYPLGGLMLGGVVVTALVVGRQVNALRDNHLMVMTDHLTGLANRGLLHTNLGRSLARSRGTDQTAVLMLDLDGFKEINDSYGHEAGDAVLVAFADVLRSCVRSSDTSARLGGDEFALVLAVPGGVSDAVMVAERILARLHAPITIDGPALTMRTSIGIAMSGEDVTDGKDILHRADTAMYRAKRQGRHGYEIYGVERDEAELLRGQLLTDLRGAVERAELVLHYQPIVSLQDGKVIGVEALVRWLHPRRGMVPPVEFIPLAEEHGLIDEIGAWVMESACRQAAAWRPLLPAGHDLHLSVNLSPNQVRNPLIVSQVEAVLARTGFDPASLVLELTEGVLMGDTEDTVVKLTALRARGVRIAIDDFGTGYSSLGYLTRLPIDILKIDRCFIAELGQGTQASAVAEAVIRLSQALRLETVAEGIELESQATGMRELGCVLGQGYYFARPLDAGQLELLLRDLATKERAGYTPELAA
jgi:diguanylate cyclase (GGDEF)-like protein